MTTQKESEVVSKAEALARSAHGAIDHLRKYTGEPYAEHLGSVARMVGDANGTEEMVAAAWLHDVLEDTTITREELEKVVGPVVTQYVLELTDVSRPEDGNRAIRKAKDRDHLALASSEAQTIKLADLIDNARSIIEHDQRFAKTFMLEMEGCLGILTRGDPQLHRMADQIVAEWKGLATRDLLAQPRSREGEC